MVPRVLPPARDGHIPPVDLEVLMDRTSDAPSTTRARAGRILAFVVVVAVVSLLGGGSAYAVYWFDASNADRILPGVSIAGVDVGGMTRQEARGAVEAAVAPSLDRTITARIGDEQVVRSRAELGVSAGVDRAVARAVNASDSLSQLERTYVRVTDEAVDVSIRLRFAFDRSPVRALVRQAAADVYAPARDASIELRHGRVVFVRSREGSAIDTRSGVATVMAAMRSSSPEVSISVQPVAPTVTEASLGKTIAVNLTTNELTLYDGFRAVRRYDVGTAMRGYRTPRGIWSVVDKQQNPTWVNPAPDTWGADMPSSIPGGPNNPLGTRALYLDAPGIRIHGTPDTASVGGYVSHGCIRMRMGEVEELYPLVPVGTPVIIYGAPPWGSVRHPGTPGT